MQTGCLQLPPGSKGKVCSALLLDLRTSLLRKPSKTESSQRKAFPLSQFRSQINAIARICKNQWHWLGCFVPLAITLFALGLDGLRQWDTTGHLLASMQFSKSIWPDFVGWNPNQLGGYPQGFFYPSLFHWLVGLTGKFFDIRIGFQVWVIFTLVLLPVSAFLALRSAFDDRPEAQWAFLGWCLVFFIPKNPVGGDLYSTIRIGLLSQAWGMIWLHFYLLALWRPGKRHRDLHAGWLLGVTILSHSIVGLAGLLLLPWFRKPRSIAMILTIAFLTCAPWAVPFLLKRALGGGGPTVFFSARTWTSTASPSETAWLAGTGGLLSALALWAGRKSLSLPLAIQKSFLALAMPVAVIEGLHFFESSLFYALGSIHWYRFQGFFWYLLIPPLFFAWGRAIQSIKLRVTMICFVVTLLSWAGFHCGNERTVGMDASIHFDPGTRFLAHLSSKGFQDHFSRISPHFLSDFLGLAGAATLNGLFVESSPTSPFMMATMQEAFFHPLVWGVQPLQPEPSLLARHLRWLGVNTLITNLQVPEPKMRGLPLLGPPLQTAASARRGNDSSEEMLFIYPLTNKRVERVHSITPVEPERWNDGIYDWWFSSTREDLPIEQPLGDPAGAGLQGTPSSVSGPDASSGEPRVDPDPLYSRPSEIRIVIDTRSDQQSWYLLKEGYFPNWTARGEDGVKIPLMRAAPNYIAFFGKGRVTLEFRLSPIERAAQLIGWLMLLSGLIWFLAQRLILRSGAALLLFAILPSEPAIAMARKAASLEDLKTGLLIMGPFHACTVTNGVVGCWGMNRDGQLGVKRGLYQSEKIASTGWPSGILGGAAGLGFTCFHDGQRVFCSGRIGDFRSEEPRLLFRSDTRIDALKAGSFGLCGWSRETHSLQCFGNLEDGSPLEKLGKIAGVEDFSIGSNHVCYRDQKGIWCRSATGEKSPFFEKIRALSLTDRVGELVSGPDRNCFTIESEGLYCRKGTGTERSRKIPPPPEARARIPKKIAVGSLHMCGIWDAEVYCEGDNSFSQAHLARSGGAIHFLDSWQKAPMLTDVSDLQAAWTTTCALVNQYRFCWGFIGNGSPQ